MRDLICYAKIPGNAPGKRLGLVKWYEAGYYPSDYDHPRNTDEQVEQHVRRLNEQLGIPSDVAESAFAGSMFGWHVPAANQAIEFFKQKTLAEVTAGGKESQDG